VNYSEVYVLFGTPVEKRNACGILVGKPEGNNTFAELDMYGRFNIEMGVKEKERECRLASSGSE
jgi:hypothetical protein